MSTVDRLANKMLDLMQEVQQQQHYISVLKEDLAQKKGIVALQNSKMDDMAKQIARLNNENIDMRDTLQNRPVIENVTQKVYPLTMEQAGQVLLTLINAGVDWRSMVKLGPDYHDKIGMIKFIRNMSGSGLKEAKDYVESTFDSDMF